MAIQNTFTLKNGLRVLLQPVKDSNIVVINLMYLVGSRNEDPNKTGLAHLLEHIAFGGSQHVENYDKTLQAVGGKNNAYTSSDVTNYWCQLPANQLEVGLYLESDRLLGLSYKPEVLEVQRNVVIEEFKESYLNKPYGDVWSILCNESYKKHPYSWSTIGKKISHIESITQKDVIAFGEKFYTPSNAVLVVVGGFDLTVAYSLVKKWFDDIPAKPAPVYKLPQEDNIKSSHLHVTRDVPQNAFYKTFHIPGRVHEDYSAFKILLNYFDDGKSSLFYKELVEKKELASSIEAYFTETFDPGLFVIEAKLQDSVAFEIFDEALQVLMQRVMDGHIEEKDLQKAKNQEEAHYAFAQISLINKAEELAYAVTLGDKNFWQEEIKRVLQCSKHDIQRISSKVFDQENSHTVYYKAQINNK